MQSINKTSMAPVSITVIIHNALQQQAIGATP